MIRKAALYLVRDVAIAFLHQLELLLDPGQAQKAADYDQQKTAVEAKEQTAKQEIEEIEGRLTGLQTERQNLQTQLAAEQAAISKANEELERIQNEKSETLGRISDQSDHDALRDPHL
jgi:septal ring factor EnvC (AmiA/AmiB activator)